MKQQSMDSERRIVNEEISYYKDLRTGLCFAGLSIGSPAQTITNVPCSPEVEKFIK